MGQPTQGGNTLVDPQRLWDRHMALAAIGGLPNGGVDRQALTLAEAEARIRLIEWGGEIGLAPEVDCIGNLFLRYPGRDAAAAPVVIGSHIDTQPTGGRFDGVFGVLSGLEALHGLRASGWEPERSVDLVAWNNEEGCRFPPTTMGSSVFSGALPVAEALDTVDGQGVSVADALQAVADNVGSLPTRPLGFSVHAFLEAHIEQGPVLEARKCPLGVVTGVQGLRWYRIDVRGQSAHAGTTPESLRRDALVAAHRMLATLRVHFLGGSDHEDTRFTVGRFQVQPGVPNTIPGHVHFTIDFRHPDAERLGELGDAVASICREHAGPCEVTVEAEPASPPIQFAPSIVALLDRAARAEGVEPLQLMSGATHDAKWLSTVAPAGMLFIPCKDGISHNEAESAEPAHLEIGARVLQRALRELAA